MIRTGLFVVVAVLAACKAEQDDAAEGSAAPAASNPARKPEGTRIPRSMADKGQYYLLRSTRDGDVITALHKRVGVDSVGWTKTESNCKTRQMREIGYSEDGPGAIGGPSTKWFELVEGSSKSDLFHFLCDH
jgi:hypothetical protein